MEQAEVNQPIQKSGSNKTIFIVLAIAIFLFLCFCCGTFMAIALFATPSPTIIEDNDRLTEIFDTVTPQRDEVEYLDVEETANLDGLKLSVNEFDMEYMPEDDFYSPDTDMKYVAVELYMVNDSDESVYYSDYNFKLKDSDNYSYGVVFGGAKQPTFSSGTLPAGQEHRGWITYEVPAKETVFSLLYTESFGGKSVEFSIK